MVSRTRGVRTVKKGKIATHIVIQEGKKTKEDRIKWYTEKTGIHKPKCSQNLRKLKIQTGKNQGKKVAEKCAGVMVAAHVKLNGIQGIFTVPMCNKHNDSWGGYPYPGDGVVLKKCKAVKVNHSSSSTQTSSRRVASNKSSKNQANKIQKRSINTKIRNLSKAKTLRRARRNGQQTWSWKGTRMGNVDDYVIKRGSRRVAKK
tara:strand:- start:130 stop:735 length:606 start_codon:yes stop_codon:yes gene_type:complete